MKSALVGVILFACSSAAIAGPIATSYDHTGNHTLVDAVYVRPLYRSFKHCGGACLKSGSLSWFCLRDQECYLNCATAPAVMKCAMP